MERRYIDFTVDDWTLTEDRLPDPSTASSACANDTKCQYCEHQGSIWTQIPSHLLDPMAPLLLHEIQDALEIEIKKPLALKASKTVYSDVAKLHQNSDGPRNVVHCHQPAMHFAMIEVF